MFPSFFNAGKGGEDLHLLHPRDFLAVVFDAATGYRGPLLLELRALTRTVPPLVAGRRWVNVPFNAEALDAALRWAATMNAQGHHIIFGPQPRVRCRGTAEDVPFYQSFMLDFDPKQGDPAERIAHLHKFGFVPTVEVNSGHGRHAYLCLRDPVPVEQGFATARRLARYAGSDHVFSPSACMRLPGTMNVKPNGPPLPCHVTALRPDALHTAAGIEVTLDLIGAPKLAPEETVLRSPRQRSALAHGSLAITARDLSHEQRERLEELFSRLSPKFQTLARDPRGTGYPSRSEAVMGMARALRNAGADYDEAELIFRALPRGIGVRVMESGLGWLEGTLNKLYEGPERDPLPRESTLRLLHVAPVPLYYESGRFRLHLHVESGPHAGTSFEGLIELASPCAPLRFMFPAFGVAVPPPGEREAVLRSLIGRRAPAVLAPDADNRPKVKLWRPSVR